MSENGLLLVIVVLECDVKYYSVESEEIPTFNNSYPGIDNVIFSFNEASCEKITGPMYIDVVLTGTNSWCNYSQSLNNEELEDGNLTIQGLQPFCNYSAVLKLYRRSKQIEKTIPAAFETKETVPNKINQLEVTSKGKDHISLRWLPPFPPTGHLSEYNIQYYLEESYYSKNKNMVIKPSSCKLWPDFHCVKIQLIDDNSYILSVKPVYTIQVQSKNEGSSDYSEPTKKTRIWADGFKKPDPPYGLSLEWTEDNFLIISWYHPNETNGILSEFEINVNGVMHKSVKIYSVEDYLLVYNITIKNDLTLPNDYHVEIKAHNKAGGSKPVSKGRLSPPPIPEESIKNIKATNELISVNFNEKKHYNKAFKRFLYVFITGCTICQQQLHSQKYKFLEHHKNHDSILSLESISVPPWEPIKAYNLDGIEYLERLDIGKNSTNEYNVASATNYSLAFIWIHKFGNEIRSNYTIKSVVTGGINKTNKASLLGKIVVFTLLFISLLISTFVYIRFRKEINKKIGELFKPLNTTSTDESVDETPETIEAIILKPRKKRNSALMGRMPDTICPEQLKLKQRSIPEIKAAANAFIERASYEFEEESTDIPLQESLPPRRVRNVKKIAGEESSNAHIEDAYQKFTVEVHNVILDALVESIEKRFQNNKELYLDVAFFSPSNFDSIRPGNIPQNSLEKLSKKISWIDKYITKENLKNKLIHFANAWEIVKMSIVDEYSVINFYADCDDYWNEFANATAPSTEVLLIRDICKSCKSCVLCCYKILVRYNFYSEVYNILTLAYKYLLTLPTTQHFYFYLNSILDLGNPLFTTQNSRRVKLENFRQYVKQACDTNELSRQHALFPRGATKPWSYGATPENKAKNRYNNLIAYNHSRIVLNKIEGDAFSDYINASYIDGYQIPKAYIATQGPKKNTVFDFWRMVWQENATNIVILANVYENNKKKMEQYWPNKDEQVTFGDFTIISLGAEIYANYEYRTFHLKYQDSKPRQIRQLHFTAWPDHGVPLYPQSLVPILEKMLTFRLRDFPIVVHCSAGVGRTGTVILCDICLRMAASEGFLDVLAMLEHVRNERANMVDNVEQFKLVHLVILDCLMGLRTSIPINDDFAKIVDELLQGNSIASQLQYIQESEWEDDAMKSVAFMDEEDMPLVSEKNRFPEIIPDNIARVFLCPYPESDPSPSSTYINAVRVDAFCDPGRFIVTQFPLPNTVGDFWRLVAEKSISVIVCLNDLPTKDKSCGLFFPVRLDTFSPVETIEVRHLKSKNFQVYTILVFEMTTKGLCEDSKTTTVEIVKFRGWRISEKVPDHTDFTSFVEDAIVIARKSSPALITCYDGATASGLFIAMSFLMEKIKLEHACDVCQAVRSIRTSRKQFTNSEEQLMFLYKASLLYVEEKFNQYSNLNA